MTSEEVRLPIPSLLVVAGFAAAVVAQGGYYLPGRVLSGLLVGVAVVLARPKPNLLAVLGAALAGWAILRGLLEGAGSVAAVAVFVGAVLVVAQTKQAQRELLATAVVWVGALVALTGWIAVVFRIPGWMTVAEGLLRAGSTLTYPNAMAAVLAVAAVLSLVLESVPLMATFLVCTGIGATMSRAGVLALGAGLVVLCVCQGVRKTVTTAGSPLLGAAVAVGALLPTVHADDRWQPLVAFAGLLVGAAITLGLPRLTRFALPAAVLVTVAAAAVVWLFADRLATRVSFDSPDRGGATGAALDLVAKSPIMGTGPGKALFLFADPDAGARVMRYVHNEYLQVLVELGVVGLLLVLAIIGATLWAMWRGRGTQLWAGALAAVVVVLVHSAFDFLWHLPVVLILAGLCAGLGLPSTKDEVTRSARPATSAAASR